MEDDIQYEKQYGVCDYCGKRTRVLVEYLNGWAVNSYCKTHKPKDTEDKDD